MWTNGRISQIGFQQFAEQQRRFWQGCRKRREKVWNSQLEINGAWARQPIWHLDAAATATIELIGQCNYRFELMQYVHE